ncbi:MAG: thermonuclease family protein [Candidatus Falkowbacteria bacterium]
MRLVRSRNLLIASIIPALWLGWYWLRPSLPPRPMSIDIDSCTVSRVIDGDTLDADCAGKITRVRMIGVDTPEVVDPRKTVQCFGQEASAFSKKQLSGQKVKLEADSTQDDKDVYGRLLRYIRLPDGRLFNLQLIEDGYAFEYTYRIPYRYQAQFKEAEQQARIKKIGLWADSACAGQHGSIAPVVTAASSTSSGQDNDRAMAIKKSRSNICHQPGSASYEQTKVFTPYTSINDCLKSGGRMPKNK